MPGEKNAGGTGANDSVFGSKMKPTVIERFSTRWEAWLRNLMATIFLAGFAVFAAVFVHATGLKEWYEFAIVVSALVVGTVLTRARRIKFFGAELELETMVDAVLFEQAIKGLWGWPVHRYPPPHPYAASVLTGEVRGPEAATLAAEDRSG